MDLSPLILFIINILEQFLASKIGTQLVYLAIFHTTKYILKKAWTPILNAMMEDVPGEYQWILETLYWFIVDQIVRHDANIIASNVVVIITLALQPQDRRAEL